MTKEFLEKLKNAKTVMENKMKIFTKFAMVLFFICIIIACNSNVEVKDEDPTTKLTTYIGPNNRVSAIGKYVSERSLVQQSTFSDLCINYVIGGDSINEARFSEMLTMLAEGKTVVILSPTHSEIKTFYQYMKTFLSSLDSFISSNSDFTVSGSYIHLFNLFYIDTANNPSFTGMYPDNGNKPSVEAVAFRGDTVFVVTNPETPALNENYAYISTPTDLSIIPEEQPDSEIEYVIENVTSGTSLTGDENYYDNCADDLFDWINEYTSEEDSAYVSNEEGKALLAKEIGNGNQYVLDDSSATKSIIEHVVAFGVKGKSEERKIHIQQITKSWIYYADKIDKDYILCKQTFAIHNEQWNCNQSEDKTKWDKIFGLSKAYGPYMKSMTSTQRLSNGINKTPSKVSFDYSHYSPSNSIGSTTFSSGQSISLSVSGGMSGGTPTGGFSTGFSYTDSRSESVSDVTTAFSTVDNCHPKWEISISCPSYSRKLFRMGRHSIAPVVSRKTFTPSFYWLWTVDDAKKNNNNYYKIDSTMLYSSEVLERDNWSSYRYYTNCTRNSAVVLPTPCHYKVKLNVSIYQGSKYSTSAVPLTDAQIEQIKKWIPEYKDFYEYLTVEDDVKSNWVVGAKDLTDLLCKKITDNKVSLREKGFSGPYTVYVNVAGTEYRYGKTTTI